MNFIAVLIAAGAFVVTLVTMFKLVGFWSLLLFLFMVIYGARRR